MRDLAFLMPRNVIRRRISPKFKIKGHDSWMLRDLNGIQKIQIEQVPRDLVSCQWISG
jgi:hypothetical protein